MKIIIYAKTAQDASRRRKPRTGETLGHRSFDDFKGKAEPGFTNCEIIGDNIPTDKAAAIQNAYCPKAKKKDE